MYVFTEGNETMWHIVEIVSQTMSPGMKKAHPRLGSIKCNILSN